MAMRILWVKAGGLLPLDSGGKIRSYHTIKQLARRHHVTLYSFYPELPDDSHNDLETIVDRVVVRPLKMPKRRSFSDYLNFARILLSGRSYTMAKYYQRAVRRDMKELCAQDAWDVIVCDFIYPAGILPWSDKPPTILFTHNVEAEVWHRHSALVTTPMAKLAYWLEYRALARAEKQYSNRANHIVAVSPNNADSFSMMVGEPSRVSLMPTGVDTEFFTPDDSAEAVPSDFVFVGSMDWMPNEDSVLFFANDIFPLIRERLPTARFWAVGRNPSPKLQRLHDGEHTFITGAVPDVRPYLHRAGVCIVPMRSGSGTRLKIFEAMAAGRPVISTTIGAEGLPVKDGEHLLIRDTPRAFADAAVSMALSNDARNRLGVAARRFVVQHCSWSAAAHSFENILQRHAGATQHIEHHEVPPEPTKASR